MVFLSPSRQMPGYHLKIRPRCFHNAFKCSHILSKSICFCDLF
jgi:hypothetical protein